MFFVFLKAFFAMLSICGYFCTQNAKGGFMYCKCPLYEGLFGTE